MITLEQLPLLCRIASKLDLSAVGKVLRRKDLIPEGKDLKSLNNEQLASLVFEVGAAIIPQMEAISNDVVTLVAVTKGISVKEAGKLGAFESIKELAEEAGVLDFFIKRLKLNIGLKL